MTTVHEKCLKEQEWGELKATLKYLTESLARIETRVCSHIQDGEKNGGYRDRLVIAENQIKQNKEIISVLKRGYWKVGITAGFIGALFGHLTPDLVKAIEKLVLHAF